MDSLFCIACVGKIVGDKKQERYLVEYVSVNGLGHWYMTCRRQIQENEFSTSYFDFYPQDIVCVYNKE